MRYYKKWFAWLLSIMVFVLTFTLGGCSSTGTKDAVTGSNLITVTSTSPGVVSTLEATQAPTAEPFILDGAITTDSGLQYLEITAGDGSFPEIGNIIKMNYIVSLPDGTEIFNTANQPETAIWGRNQLLPGWEEGVGLMKAGGKAKLVLPPDLALGEIGAGIVPPNSQLIMEVELLSVTPAPLPALVAFDELLVMDNGVHYADLVLGVGTEAITGTNVTTHYTIWIAGPSSDEFVISSEYGQPVTFMIGRGDTVFNGWEYGVIGMRVGGKRLLIIPPDLALGTQDSGSIPANSTLKMEITLINVKEPRKATQVDEKDYTTTASGLKYFDIQVGTGITPTIGQAVVVNYVGWLEDGTQFDNSYDQGEPFAFSLGMGNVITGWDQGVSSMRVGGIRQIVIPPDLGYGETGSGSTIPPGATLIFEVELLEIKP